uniref:Methionine aminopeptidase n=1 Tax=Cyclophora tenuis TaxID=216820 RepID=A0A7S1DDL8_CYCTE
MMRSSFINGTATKFLLVVLCVVVSTSRAFVPIATTKSTKKSFPLYMKKTVRSKKKGDRSKPKGFAGAIRDMQLSTFSYAGDVRPGKQSPQRVVVDEAIVKPDYFQDGTPKNKPQLLPWVIEVKTAQEIAKMRVAGRVAREVLDIGGRMIKPGVTTDEIDARVHKECLARGAYPSPLNYHGFPKSCCTSVNEVICHGIPDDRPLVKGDIINLDITCFVDGYHGDCSEMFVVGGEEAADDAAKQLLQTTYDCWISAMNICMPGKDYKDIGAIIEDYVAAKGFTTVKNFCGHGIGSVFHANPNILHYRNNEPNGQMTSGHTFTIEPMICEGVAKPLTWPDQWTATTVDGKRSAQFEHTLLVTAEGVEALTGKIETSPLQFWERDSAVKKGIWLGTTPDAKKRAEDLSANAKA